MDGMSNVNDGKVNAINGNITTPKGARRDIYIYIYTRTHTHIYDI